MPISFDVAAGATNTSSNTSITFAIAPAANANSLIVVGCNTYNGSITGATYNSQTMTPIYNYTPTLNRFMAFFYYLNGTADGNSHNVVVSFNSSNGGEFVAGAYYGVKQSGQPDANNKNDGSGITSDSVAVTTIADNCWLIGMVDDNSNNGSQVAGANTKQRILKTFFDDFGLYDSNGPQTPAGSYSLAASWTGSAVDSFMVASFAPVASASHNLPLLGVGI